MKADARPPRLPLPTKRQRLQQGRRNAAIILEIHRQQMEQGDGGALLAAIDTCAAVGIALPHWLATAYRERYARFRDLECATLGEAFDVLPRAYLEAKRKQSRLPWKIWWRVTFGPEPRKSFTLEDIKAGRLAQWRAANPKRKTKQDWKKIGSEFRISGGLARKYYYGLLDAEFSKMLPEDLENSSD